MKTRRFCPHCGRPLRKSYLGKGENKYSFQCFACGEDFYRFEVLRKKDLPSVLAVRQIVLEKASNNNEYIIHSIRKPYPNVCNY